MLFRLCSFQLSYLDVYRYMYHRRMVYVGLIHWCVLFNMFWARNKVGVHRTEAAVHCGITAWCGKLSVQPKSLCPAD